ncbi:unnamed protein product [Clonostachys rhizophaga]|uniref:Uncharacterized protein n=1 Tax=Clonostachys rhizophaga TaxID=160324 RepID=A0A9N9VY31_9HYPO|nr:unnamed protein product [Clonostachys rhizophaga]
MVGQLCPHLSHLGPVFQSGVEILGGLRPQNGNATTSHAAALNGNRPESLWPVWLKLGICSVMEVAAPQKK